MINILLLIFIIQGRVTTRTTKLTKRVINERNSNIGNDLSLIMILSRFRG